MHAERIVSIKKIGIRKTLDIEVNSNTHIYYSNNIANSNSHAIGYAETGYWTAYLKAHFPLHFFCAWLSMAQEKQNPQDEVRELILESKYFNIDILPPSIESKEVNFHLENKAVRFGLSNIKSVGKSKVEKALIGIKEAEESIGKKVGDFSYYELLIHIFPNIDKTSVNNMIACGVFSDTNIPRRKMLYEYKKASILTDRELKWIKEQKFSNISEAFDGLINSKIPNKKRVEAIKTTKQLLDAPPEDLKDTPMYIASVEGELLGCSIVCEKLDSCDTATANCTCAEFAAGKALKDLSIALQVDTVKEWMPKDSHDPIIFATCHDSTGSIELLVPSYQVKESGSYFFKGNTILVTGYKGKGDRLNIRKVHQI